MIANLPKISIITPSFNQGAYIEETILSIINQKYPNVEYIIIDGGSTDNSVDIIKKYEQYLTYWISEHDQGQSHAINKGFKRATGDIVCWINSDDVLMPGALVRVSEYFIKYPNIDVLMGWTLRIDKHSNIIFNHFIPKQYKLFSLLGLYVMPQQSWFWKSEMFKYIGYLDETIHTCMDVDFLIRQVLSDPKIKHVPFILGGFRQHEESKTASSEKWTDDFAKLEKRYKILGYRSKINLGRFVYGFFKLVNGYYFRQYFFSKRWKGTHYLELFNSDF